MVLDPVKNFAKATVLQGYAAGTVSIVLSSGYGAKLPDPSSDGAFNLVWWNWTDYKDPSDDPSVEIVRCTARAADILTVARAQEGTSDVNHNTGGRTYKMVLAPTKKMMGDIDDTLKGQLFEVNDEDDLMPAGKDIGFEADGNNDLMPIDTMSFRKDDDYELDGNGDIMPKGG